MTAFNANHDRERCERYPSRCLGFDPGVLPWCRGPEFFDSWRWVLVTGEAYEQHTAESLQADLACWLEEQ